jgi:hypothetical protein
MAREAGNMRINDYYTNGTVTAFSDEQLQRFEALVRADERSVEREACHALRQTLPNPHEHCQVSAHAYDMALVAYGAAIRARGNT